MKKQVSELKSHNHGAPVVQYDEELRRVRNALGDEKAQLLDDLVSFFDHTLCMLSQEIIYGAIQTSLTKLANGQTG